MEVNLKALKNKIAIKKAVILDLDNTLYSYRPCHEQGLRSAYKFYDQKIASITFRDFNKRYQAARHEVHKRLKGQAASHSRLLYFQGLLEGSSSVSLALKFEKKYWVAFLNKMKLESWVLPLLRYCRLENKKVCIVTNLTTGIQMQKLKKLKISNKIDFLVTSEEAGHEKPHPAIFRLAFKKLKTHPKDIFSLGDDPRTDRLTV